MPATAGDWIWLMGCSLWCPIPCVANSARATLSKALASSPPVTPVLIKGPKKTDLEGRLSNKGLCLEQAFLLRFELSSKPGYVYSVLSQVLGKANATSWVLDIEHKASVLLADDNG